MNPTSNTVLQPPPAHKPQRGQGGNVSMRTKSKTPDPLNADPEADAPEDSKALQVSQVHPSPLIHSKQTSGELA